MSGEPTNDTEAEGSEYPLTYFDWRPENWPTMHINCNEFQMTLFYEELNLIDNPTPWALQVQRGDEQLLLLSADTPTVVFKTAMVICRLIAKNVEFWRDGELPEQP